MNAVLKIKSIYRFGPRKVSKIGNRAAVYLPKNLGFLRGKIVNVVLEVFDDGGSDESSSTA